MKETKLRVIGYIRVSTEDQAASGLSLTNQRMRIRSYALAMDLDLTEIIEDAGKSAKDLVRPGMQSVLGLVEEQKTDGVITLKLDRLTRSVRDLGELIELFDNNGVALIVIQENVNTATAAGRLVANVLCSVAQWEREAIGERTRAALAVKRSRGEKTGGTVPFGYTVDAIGILEPDAREQAVVAEMVALRASGLSWKKIGERLHAKGIGNRGGTAWHGFSIQRIVEREVGIYETRTAGKRAGDIAAESAY